MERRLNCPTCRTPTTVPDQGFPVCVLTEHIKGILHDAREKNDDKSDKSQPKTHASGWYITQIHSIDLLFLSLKNNPKMFVSCRAFMNYKRHIVS